MKRPVCGCVSATGAGIHYRYDKPSGHATTNRPYHTPTNPPKTLTHGEAAVAQTAHHVADDFAGTVAFLQRQPAQHVHRKEQNDEIRAEPGRKERCTEFDDGRRLADVHRKFGGVMLQIGHDRWLRKAGASQVEQLEAVRGAHP